MTEFCGPVSSNRGLSKVFRESPGRYVSFCLGEPGKASEVTDFAAEAVFNLGPEMRCSFKVIKLISSVEF